VLVGASALAGVDAVALQREWIGLPTAVLLAALMAAVLTAVTIRVPVFTEHVRPFARSVWLTVGVAVVGLTALAGPAAFALAGAHEDLAAASSAAQRGATARAAGDEATAQAAYHDAERLAARAQSDLDGRLVSAGLVIPYVRENVIAARDAADVAQSIGVASPQAAGQRLRGSPSGVLLPFVDDAHDRLRAAVSTLDDTETFPARSSTRPPEVGVPVLVALVSMLLIGGAGSVIATRAGLDGDRELVVVLAARDVDIDIDAELERSTS
jgi:hypothetical protein